MPPTDINDTTKNPNQVNPQSDLNTKRDRNPADTSQPPSAKLSDNTSNQPTSQIATALDSSQKVSQSSDSSNSKNQNLSNVVISTPPSKIGRKKIVATIFSIIFLIGGVTAGVYLVRRQQEIRRQAASASECNQSPDCEVIVSPGNSGSRSFLRNITHVFISSQTNIRFEVGDTNDGCYHVIINGGNLIWEKVGQATGCHDISNIQVWFGDLPTPTPTPTPSSTPTPTSPPGSTPSPTSTLPSSTPSPTPTIPISITPTISAQCSQVIAYDTNWNQLSQSELSSLQPGDSVRFAVSGTTNSGSFDKARFSINGQLQPETSTLKPGGNEFYIEYTVPEGIVDFVIDGEIYHSDLGWI